MGKYKRYIAKTLLRYSGRRKENVVNFYTRSREMAYAIEYILRSQKIYSEISLGTISGERVWALAVGIDKNNFQENSLSGIKPRLHIKDNNIKVNKVESVKNPTISYQIITEEKIGYNLGRLLISEDTFN